MYKLPERGGGGEVIWAMPERKHFFYMRCSLRYRVVQSDVLRLVASCLPVTRRYGAQNIQVYLLECLILITWLPHFHCHTKEVKNMSITFVFRQGLAKF